MESQAKTHRLSYHLFLSYFQIHSVLNHGVTGREQNNSVVGLLIILLIPLEFESAGAVFSIEESSGPQNLWVSIVLKVSKSAGVKGDVPLHPLHPLQPC